MFKAIIVDDEPSHREGIARHVNWKGLGFDVPLQAESGEEAINLIKENEIDVVIADICMPSMNGLEMIHRINSIRQNLDIIIISGYDEFEYARAAMEEGARAYLLKPVKVEEIEKWLKKFRDEIIHRQQTIDDDMKLKKSLNVSIDLARKSFLESIIVSYDSHKEYSEQILNTLGLPTHDFDCLLGVITTYDCDKQLYNDSNFQDRIISRLEDYIKKDAFFDERYILIAPTWINEIIVLGYDFQRYTKSELTQYFKNLCKVIQEEYGVSASVVLNLARTDWRGVNDLYKQTALYMYNHKNEGTSQVFLIEDERTLNDKQESIDFAKEMSNAIAVQDVDGLVNLTNIFFCRDKKVPFVSIKAIVCSIVNEILKALNNMDKYDNAQCMNVWQDILITDNTVELRRKLLKLIFTFNESINEKNKNKKHYTIDRALEYLNADLSRDVTVQDLALYLNINPSYLSVLFKKEVGLTITEYVTKKRIDKAKEYLRSSTKKVNDIASMVGYQTPAYFIYQFKKLVGCTPAEFRERRL